MKKRTKLTAAAVSLGALMTVGGTLAWFTDSETATNTVTTGYVDLEIKEHMPSVEDQENDGYTAEKNEDGSGIIYSNLVPGVSIEKDPSILYTGSADAYVRYRVIVGSNDSVDPGFNQDFLGRVLVAYKDGKNVNLIPDKDGWIYVTDEDKQPIRIEAGDKEPVDVLGGPMFDEIKLNGEYIGNEFANTAVQINIEAEAVQADNIGENIDATLDEVKEAFGESEDENGRVDQFYDDEEVSDAVALNN